jgi:hypothetical protein
MVSVQLKKTTQGGEFGHELEGCLPVIEKVKALGFGAKSKLEQLEYCNKKST